MRTHACVVDDHRTCRCETTGQDPLYAGLVLAIDDRGEFVPRGFCDCPCHADERRAP